MQDMVCSQAYTKAWRWPPLRDREGYLSWGRPDMALLDQHKLFDDNRLLIRQMYLSSLASSTQTTIPALWLEHPADPAWASDLSEGRDCCSIWAMPAVQQWERELGLHRIHFDQCMLGQVVPKTTTVTTTLPLCFLLYTSDAAD